MSNQFMINLNKSFNFQLDFNHLLVDFTIKQSQIEARKDMSDIRNNTLVNPPPNNEKKNILNFFKVSKTYQNCENNLMQKWCKKCKNWKIVMDLSKKKIVK